MAQLLSELIVVQDQSLKLLTLGFAFALTGFTLLNLYWSWLLNEFISLLWHHVFLLLLHNVYSTSGVVISFDQQIRSLVGLVLLKINLLSVVVLSNLNVSIPVIIVLIKRWRLLPNLVVWCLVLIIHGSSDIILILLTATTQTCLIILLLVESIKFIRWLVVLWLSFLLSR